MKKFSFLLQLELNLKNHMIFVVNEKEENDGVKEIGYFVLEDNRRAATLDDFEFLKTHYNVTEWDDDRNYINIKIYTYENLDEFKMDSLLELASTFVEFKPEVNHKIEFFVSEELNNIRKTQCGGIGQIVPVLKWLLKNNIENKINLDSLKLEDLNHLTQDI